MFFSSKSSFYRLSPFGGSEVNIDFSHYGFDKNGKWNTGPDTPHIGWQVGKGKDKKVGHILLDYVPAGRSKIKYH